MWMHSEITHNLVLATQNVKVRFNALCLFMVLLTFSTHNNNLTGGGGGRIQVYVFLQLCKGGLGKS